MNIVKITTIIKDNKRLDKNSESWLLPQSDSVKQIGEHALEIRPGLKIKRSLLGQIIEFNGGPTVKGGFSYEFSQYGNDVKMIFIGEETDYGCGDIRLVIGDCEVSDDVIVEQLTVTKKAWPK